MVLNIKQAIAAAAKATDMNQASTGGAYAPPAEGKPGVRFIAYVEIGPQRETYKDVERVREQVRLVFELHGKKWPVDDAGQPPRMTLTLTKSLNEKATFYKLFRQMNYSGKHTHMAQMLGEDFSAQVFHRTSERDGGQKLYAGFRDPASGMLCITPPFVTNEEGEDTRRNIPPAVAALRLFLWDYPDKSQWASLYIAGEYSPGKSRNVFQDAIKASPGYRGSPIQSLLEGDPDTGEADEPPPAASPPAKPPKRRVSASPVVAPAPAADEGDDDEADPLADLPLDD